MDPNPGRNHVIKFKYDQEQLTKEGIIDFVNKYKDRELVPYVKFEKNPKQRN